MAAVSVRRVGLSWVARTAGVAAAAVGFVISGVGPASAVTPLSEYVDQTYQANGRVTAILPIGNTVYIGGAFTSLRPYGAAAGTGEVTRNHLAAIDRVTGALLPWNPGTDKTVYALAASPDQSLIYVGGGFSAAGGVRRSRLAALDPVTGAPTSWAPVTDQNVYALAVSATRIYFGGTIDRVNGQARGRLAAVDAAGVLDPAWHPVADNRVRMLTTSPDSASIYVGGEFGSIDGDTTQKNLVKLTPDTGAPQPWKLHPGYPVFGVAFFGPTLFAGGNGSGGHVGAFDAATGTRLWTLQTDGGVQAVTVMDNTLYVGGHFDNVCVGVIDGATTGFRCPKNAATRHKLLAIDVTTGDLDPWNPGADSPLGVFALANSGGSLQVGGDFKRIGHLRAQQSYAQFSNA